MASFDIDYLSFIVNSNPVGWVEDRLLVGHLVEMELADNVLICIFQNQDETVTFDMTEWTRHVVPAIYVQHLEYWSVGLAVNAFDEATTSNTKLEKICPKGLHCDDLSSKHLATWYHATRRKIAGISGDGSVAQYHSL